MYEDISAMRVPYVNASYAWPILEQIMGKCCTIFLPRQTIKVELSHISKVPSTNTTQNQPKLLMQTSLFQANFAAYLCVCLVWFREVASKNKMSNEHGHSSDLPSSLKGSWPGCSDSMKSSAELNWAYSHDTVYKFSLLNSCGAALWGNSFFLYGYNSKKADDAGRFITHFSHWNTIRTQNGKRAFEQNSFIPGCTCTT